MSEPPLLHSENLAYVEPLFARFLRDPASVPADWRAAFAALAGTRRPAEELRTGPSFRPSSVFSPPAANGQERGGDSWRMALLQDRVAQLVRTYREQAHYVARIDPLGMPRPALPELEPASFGFTEADMGRQFSAASIHGPERLTLREIVERLRNTYTRSIGAQFMHIADERILAWLRQRMESTQNRLELPRREQIRILRWLTDAVVLEQFIQKKFLGSKSFSLEGAETLIPLLGMVTEKAGAQGIDEIVLGMAHRGRLNVLVNILGKSPRDVFREFRDTDPEAYLGAGDVKYHLGYSCDWKTRTGHKIHLSLCFNPSHLEFVNPVALGRLRAKQDRAGDTERRRGMVVLIHGDAAFAGEGVVQESLNLSQLEGYRVGGTLHVVVNNQIGFTTPPSEARSSVYATAVARMLKTPVFHVNGEDPEAVAQVVELAMGFRREFQRDVVIDLYCYRRLGHNEGDEPAFTQPRMYREIRKRASLRDSYLEHLFQMGGVTAAEADEIERRSSRHLEKGLQQAESAPKARPPDSLSGIWRGKSGGPERSAREVETAVAPGVARELLERLATPPGDFHLHPKIARFLEQRREMARGERPLDWAAGEALAFATLAVEGRRVRLTGQDTERGTFSQRHAVLWDQEDGRAYRIFQHLAPDQAPVEILNSPLSEAGVLGFEYGYSLDCPDGLVLWEAQFGDFCNAAQVIVDQFIASAEDKWRRLSGIVLLLPHGFEGMGPEHSSARIERFLTLGAEDNLQVVVPSTPAQYFHVLRRQVLRNWRKPLVVMTPKSLLRHPQAVSSLEDVTRGTFQRILPDAGQAPPEQARRVVLCSGKIYHELERERQRREVHDVALLRLEQLYPLRDAALRAALSPYPRRCPAVWVQEEPENMGAWRTLRARFGAQLPGGHPFSSVTRPESASPATGSGAAHKLEQAELIGEAFAGD